LSVCTGTALGCGAVARQTLLRPGHGIPLGRQIRRQTFLHGVRCFPRGLVHARRRPFAKSRDLVFQLLLLGWREDLAAFQLGNRRRHVIGDVIGQERGGAAPTLTLRQQKRRREKRRRQNDDRKTAPGMQRGERSVGDSRQSRRRRPLRAGAFDGREQQPVAS